MNFNAAIKQNVFPSLEKSLSLSSRRNIFDKNQKYLLLLKEQINEKFGHVNMFIINDFLDESKYNVHSIDVLIEMSHREFDSFIDSGMLFECYSDNINYFFKVKDAFFLYNKESKSFLKTQLKIGNKITL